MKKSQKKRNAGSSKLVELLRTGIPGYDPFKTAKPGSWLDEDSAQLALDFFRECLRHIEGAMAGHPFELEPWQKAIIGNLFGWKKKDKQGRIVRRYREAFIFIPRKNGKTPLAAGICNYVLFCDKEPGAQVYSAAADKDQAAILYRHAKGMIEQEPELAERARIYRAHKSIVLKDDEASVYKVLSADADTKHGGNSHLIIIDELHAQPNRDLVDVLQTSMASENRPQPLLIHITTSDFDRESICNEKHDYASKVRDGLIDDPSFFPVIYEALPEDDWTDPKVWAKANPNLGVSVSLEYLERECKRAQETPSYENTFKRLHLNLRTKQDTVWLNMERWDAGGEAFDESILHGRECYAGLDLSSKQDITAFSMVFPPDGADAPWYVLTRFWIPAEGAAARERTDRVPYQTWMDRGLVKACEGTLVDFDEVFADICDDGQRFRIRQIAFDKWNAQQIGQQLMKEGFEVVDVPQVISHLTAGTKALEDLVVQRQLRHGGNPVLRWMASCTSVMTDRNQNMRPIKPERKTGKRIDGIVATIMATGRAILHEEESGLEVRMI